ncbi:hypothetical protein [Clostridium saccharoperbutylacetonicum]|uniref:hypothetical protein n=1 Tax=Clostridium saccharoperbutylacetonicum TaxID=36745 RepID=UPI001DFD9FAB|nr:hypothetical protein [Clostridium saccharoperbutylacetonicum]NSB33586.1 hypothetical protein [Clostridium saccharoperbutylacetonicum]
MRKKVTITSVIVFGIIAVIFIGLILSKNNGVAASDVLAPKDLSVPILAYDDNSITLAWHKPENYNNIKNYNIYI